jgi:hypothetical protein
MYALNHYLSWYGLILASDSGKELARDKSNSPYTHTGIVMGVSVITGKTMVFHNHPDSGPALVTYEKYAAGKKAYYTGRKSDGVNDVLLRSFKQIDSKVAYSVDTYNCHDATSYSRTGKKESHGRTNTLVTLGLVGLALLFMD